MSSNPFLFKEFLDLLKVLNLDPSEIYGIDEIPTEDPLEESSEPIGTYRKNSAFK